MRKLKEITPYEIENAMKLIGKDWMLITASDGRKVNTMTASWGNMGVLWGKNVCTVYIRPQRYTYEFVECSDHLSLSFFDESYRDALKVCGTVSGRDCDKLARTGLTAATVDSVPIISQARLTIICKKLYADDIRPEKFLCDEPLSNYKQNDFHRFYICEIEKVLVAEES
ncbi:MAG: flavin reductase family protein [Clostridia bacterium]|nr:flavin reductase family protein [Clostridia bacterium]